MIGGHGAKGAFAHPTISATVAFNNEDEKLLGEKTADEPT
jgi:hypothetical protein